METLLFAVLWGIVFFLWIKRRKKSPSQAERVIGTKILVSSLGIETSESLEQKDASIYSQYYKLVDVAEASEAIALLGMIRDGKYDVIHLFCTILENGNLLAENGSQMKSSDLIKACQQGDVKLLFLAQANPGDNFMKAFTVNTTTRGVRLNFVTTFDRKGEAFSLFLQQLLEQMASGEGMPVSWVNIFPQIPGASDEVQPELIFSSGRTDVRLMP